MKFVFLLPDGWTLGGVENWSVRMARAMLRHGREACLVIAGSEKGLNRRTKRFLNGVPVHWVPPPENGWTPADWVACIGPLLPAVLFPKGEDSLYKACGVLKAESPAEVVAVGYAHTDCDEVYSLLKFHAESFDQFIGVSRLVESRLRQSLPNRILDIACLPYGVEIPSNRKVANTRNPIRLLYAGRVVNNQKRMADCAPFVSCLAARHVDFRLDVVGNGPYMPWLREDLSGLPWRIRRNVRVRGEVEPADMGKWYHNADIFVLFSEFEGHSIAMTEAMAHGCVPVVTRVSGTESAIIEGENGLLAEVGNVEALADHVARLAGDRDKLHAMSCGAQSWAKQNVSIDDMAVDLLNLLKENRKSQTNGVGGQQTSFD